MLSVVLSFLSVDNERDQEGKPEKNLEVKNITKAERKSFKVLH